MKIQGKKDKHTNNLWRSVESVALVADMDTRKDCARQDRDTDGKNEKQLSHVGNDTCDVYSAQWRDDCEVSDEGCDGWMSIAPTVQAPLSSHGNALVDPSANELISAHDYCPETSCLSREECLTLRDALKSRHMDDVKLRRTTAHARHPIQHGESS